MDTGAVFVVATALKVERESEGRFGLIVSFVSQRSPVSFYYHDHDASYSNDASSSMAHYSS
jgi:hypothetical protein